MSHEHHYTLEQANAMRGWVARRIHRIRAARAQLLALGERLEPALAALDPGLGGTYPGRGATRPLIEVSRALAELDAVDVVLRDLDQGLVDFPALRDGEEVYLCWLLREDEISFWHEPDAGFAGREPI